MSARAMAVRVRARRELLNALRAAAAGLVLRLWVRGWRLQGTWCRGGEGRVQMRGRQWLAWRASGAAGCDRGEAGRVLVCAGVRWWRRLAASGWGEEGCEGASGLGRARRTSRPARLRPRPCDRQLDHVPRVVVYSSKAVMYDTARAHTHVRIHCVQRVAGRGGGWVRWVRSWVNRRCGGSQRGGESRVHAAAATRRACDGWLEQQGCAHTIPRFASSPRTRFKTRQPLRSRKGWEAFECS